jgi:hypothetical protein
MAKKNKENKAYSKKGPDESYKDDIALASWLPTLGYRYYFYPHDDT